MVDRYEICDVHGHYLPGVDDGCKHCQESARLLELSYRQGITAVFATPHYYPVESVSGFLRRRQGAADRLYQQLEEEQLTAVPQICLGAEVAYRPGLGYEKELEKLCLGNSRYLLLELPFDRWGTGLVRDVQNICNTQGLIPILAHIERYPGQDRRIMDKLLELDVMIQMNAAELCRFGSRRKAATLLEKGYVQVLGTDCHNLTDRQPNMAPALAYLEKRGMTGVLRQLSQQSMELFRQATR